MLVICPGIHEHALTYEFLATLKANLADGSKSLNLKDVLVFRAQDPYWALSGFHILQFLYEHQSSPSTTQPIIFIGFSAGVVGAIGAAWGWQLLGGKVKAVIAVDGWGVPLFGNFSCHRLSHDFFTHWSSSLLGSGQDSFYANPPVEHLTMWRSPQTVTGWWVQSSVDKSSSICLTAAEFLTMLLNRYVNRG